MNLVRPTVAGTLACLAGAALLALGVHRQLEGVGRKPDALASRSIGIAPGTSCLPVQKQIHVSVAQIEGSSADVAPADPPDAQQPAIAQIGLMDSVPGVTPTGIARAARSEDDQSDAEVADTPPGSTHTVAPVPVRDENQAAVKTALAPVGLTPSLKQVPPKPAPLAMVRGGGPTSVLPIALVFRPGRQGGSRRIGDLRDQVRAANSQEKVFVPAATFAVPFDSDVPNGFKDSIPRGWPLADESPIAEPALLVNELGPHDPLRRIAQRWELNATPTANFPASPTSAEVDRVVAGSGGRWQSLYEMGRDSAFFDAASFQKTFWRAAVLRAAASPANLPVSLHDLRSMQVLAGTFLWVWKDDKTAATALRTLMKWQRHNAPGAGQAALLLTAILDRQGVGDKSVR